MEKLVLVFTFLILTGCANLVKPEHADKAVYKRYDITMPDRPTLNVDELTPNSTIGQAARAYELDLINITEYALKLENILKPIAESESGFEVKETTPQTNK